MKPIKKLRKAAKAKARMKFCLEFVRNNIKNLPLSSYNAAERGAKTAENLYYLVFELKAEGYNIKHDPAFYPLYFAKELKKICEKNLHAMNIFVSTISKTGKK